MAAANKPAQLAEITDAILADNVTPELRKGAKQLVFGAGDPDSQLIFIGEAPGAKEDELGEPFVGAAGRVLNEMLASIGLDRTDL